ncbi:hypothetical protein D6833_06230 [Candidatus Parcubacteria bacterium]|nr:MAG: hypothetical protein D6833_06230 [Candidatus Parcubacteria bacterium]
MDRDEFCTAVRAIVSVGLGTTLMAIHCLILLAMAVVRPSTLSSEAGSISLAAAGIEHERGVSSLDQLSASWRYLASGQPLLFT